jgi:hypothetical protein
MHGNPNPNATGDWIRLGGDCTGDPAFQLYSFYYEKFGDVKNAQNRIVGVDLTCPLPAGNGRETRVVAVTFLQRAEQPAKRYIPPNPRVPGIPGDTWYPFSSSAAFPRIATPSAALLALVLSVAAACA